MEYSEFSITHLLKKSIKFFLLILYATFVIALAFGPIIAGIWTILPAEIFGWEVSKASYLGYESTCSFAPFSSTILFGMGIIGMILLMKFWKYLRRNLKNSTIYLKYKALTNQI
ncbi:MAG: hypothetical protein ACFFKA_16055 [Candidatus Thorarchaeota archaeon]